MGETDKRMRALLFKGLVAGLAMSLLMLALRLALGVLSIPELASDRFTSALPSGVFSFLLSKLEAEAKPLLFLSLFGLQVLAGGGLGVLYGLVSGRWPAGEWQERWRAISFGLSLWTITMVTLVPALGGGLFGTSVPGGVFRFSVASLFPYLVYGISLGQALGSGS